MLAPRGSIDLPAHASGGFDHGDVHLATGRVFVAHTANGTIEVIDGERRTFERTISGCLEASGVLCAQEAGLVFAAARGAGKVLVVDPVSLAVQREIPVGPRPNGLAWDRNRNHLLVADVEDFTATLFDPQTSQALAQVELPGRPRWCIYDEERDRFLINVREPAAVLAVNAEHEVEASTIPVSVAGPHGLDLAGTGQRAFVACDAGEVVVLDLVNNREAGRVAIAGEPDAIWYNPRRDRLYVAVGKPGLIDVVDCRTLELGQRVEAEEGAHTTAFDRDRQRLYVFLPKSCRAAIFEEVDAPA
jgi:DNA-binding beta-propeller fold protein YncE